MHRVVQCQLIASFFQSTPSLEVTDYLVLLETSGAVPMWLGRGSRNGQVLISNTALDFSENSSGHITVFQLSL